MTKDLAIAYDTAGWWKKYAEFSDKLHVSYDIFDIERSDWIEKIKDASLVLWRPNLDSPYLQEAKEKIYFIDKILQKRIIPNWSTFWHYDNKRAQIYLAAFQDLRFADTFVSFSRDEALDYAASATYPLVSKTSGGASASGVRLLKSEADARREIRQCFKRTFTSRVLNRFDMNFSRSPRDRSGYVFWQQYLPGNDRDLRISIIGKEWAFAFWRMNRPGDFRASGSGRLVYEGPDCEQEIRYCTEVCRKLDLDIMAFDIVYSNNEFFIIEMSYTFVDKPVFEAPTHYHIDDNYNVLAINEQCWPQMKIVEYGRKETRIP